MKKKETTELFQAKEGDEFTVTACYFQIEDWTEGSPCVIIEPILLYQETNGADSSISELLEDIVCYGKVQSSPTDYVERSLQWAGKSLKSVSKAIKTSLKTQLAPYKSVYSEVIQVKVKIVLEDGQMSWEVLQKIEYSKNDLPF